MRSKRIPRSPSLMAVALVLSVVARDVSAEDGGTKDSTGLVWSQSQALETGSWWTWTGATTRAASYAVWDLNANGNPVLYDDWRLPTIAEIRTAIQDGTMNLLVPRTPEGPYYFEGTIWALETKGNKAYVVQVLRDRFTWDVIGGGSTDLWLKGSACESFFVRGRTSSKK
jgi:hypothetical protein